MWDGIIVQGDKTYPQTLSTNNNITAMSDQGFVYLVNATIENAYEALRVWKYEDGWVSTNTGDNQGGTGGIVRAVNTTFRNNRRSAEFMWYKSLMGVPGGVVVEVPNKSYFKNCDFITNDEHSDQHDFSAHVTAWGVNGLRFEGCRFKNNITATAQTSSPS
ncbi:MAG: hypothetical protein IPN22_03410 [Bacteroidetes bacterium]|nr:hypothetical protein [Bacteroidota bacterium]